MIWNGIDVDIWGPKQTLQPYKPRISNRFTGYDSLGFDWWDFIEAIPLEIRYASFVRRLSQAKAYINTGE